MKRFYSMLLVIAMCFALLCSSAFAVDTDVYENEITKQTSGDSLADIGSPVLKTINDGYDNEIMPLDHDRPSNYWNLSGGNYTGYLIDLAATKGSFTKYYFTTGTGKIYLRCNLERSGTTTNKERTLRIELYEKEAASSYGSLVDSRTVNFESSEVSVNRIFYGLDTNKFYFIRFVNESGTTSGSSLDISGTIIFSENLMD